MSYYSNNTINLCHLRKLPLYLSRWTFNCWVLINVLSKYNSYLWEIVGKREVINKTKKLDEKTQNSWNVSQSGSSYMISWGCLFFVLETSSLTSEELTSRLLFLAFVFELNSLCLFLHFVFHVWWWKQGWF